MNFCTNADYIHTQNDLQSSPNLSSPKDELNRFQNIHTYQQPQYHVQEQNNQRKINNLNRNQRNQIKKLTTLERNQKIAALLTVAIAFTQKIEQIKQKICGYPSSSFMPQKYYQMLDLNDKNYVDIQDVKQFVSNPKVRDKDICSLFKRMNSDPNANNTKLTYLGYLNLLKPCMNQQLARDLLLRDTLSKAKRINKVDTTEISMTLLQPTQQSILLLFQQLLLLHCICSTEHQSAKQLLMEQYMLNTKEIYEIIGFSNQRKGCLTILWEFITKNSEFQVDLNEMRYILAFLKNHQFALKSQKCLAQLFMPSNVSQQLLRSQKNQTIEFVADISADNHYYNTYLKRQNLISTQNNLNNFMMKKTGQNMDGYVSRPNFLQFVHPQSIKRMDNPYNNKQDKNIKIQQKNVQILINPTNNSYNNVKNSSYFIKDRNSQNFNYQNLQNLSKRFSFKQNNPLAQNDLKIVGQYGSGPAMKTPLLQQFMKQSNIKKNMAQNVKKSRLDSQRMNQYYAKANHFSGENSLINSQSAFQVVDYAYQGPNTANKPKHSYVINNPKNQKKKDKGLESRYNMVVSQYHNNNNDRNQKNNHYENRNNTNNSINAVMQNSGKHPNYINSIGMSQSKIVPNQSFGKSGILDAFIKHF